MSALLAELFKHNLWANLRLLDACSGLTDEQLDALVPGTFGSVRDTLVHLLATEGRYVALLTDTQPENPLRESGGFPGIEELRARAQSSGEALIEIAANMAPNKVLYGTYGGEPFEMEVRMPIVQAIHHAIEHRTQIITTLSHHGIEPPDLSGWAWGDDKTP